MDNQPLVSVVIPAYNAGKTLERMLRSVMAQTYQRLQMIVVDDGSTDDTAAVANRLAEEDPRILFIRQENAGVSAARNRGLACCEGVYVRFADADDSLPRHSIAVLVARAEADGTELVIGGYTEYAGEVTRQKNMANRSDTIGMDEMLRIVNRKANSIFYGVLWNKLFRRDLIEGRGIRFEPCFHWGEDFAFVMDYLAGVNRVAFLTEAVYDYRRRLGSASLKQVADCLVHPLDNIRTKRQLYAHLKRLFQAKGAYAAYANRLWLYLFRVGIN